MSSIFLIVSVTITVTYMLYNLISENACVNVHRTMTHSLYNVSVVPSPGDKAVMMAFSSHVKIMGEGSVTHSMPALFLFLFLKWRSACT